MELPTLKVRFKYSGVVRHVENVTVEPETQSIIGMEVRKGGKFSNKIKRYSTINIRELSMRED